MTDLDILWIVIATALVLLMQCGFLLLEAGMTRAKNYINVAVKNLADLGMAILLFWLFGYGLMFGANQGGVVGFSDFAMDLTTVAPETAIFFLFQVVFAGTTVTIISGAIAERTAFGGYIGIVLVMAVVYPVFGHWVWGGGWLAGLGFVDFAGSTVVHSMGGWAALAAAIIIGPRTGRFADDGTSTPIRPSNLPLAMTGAVVLWFGWIGFNGGSTLAFNSSVPAVIAVTIMGGAAGLVTALFATWWRDGYPVPTAPLNGALAGLVAVTAGAHALSTVSALLVGAVGAIVALWLESLLDRFQIDDAVGAVPVHLGAGIWGTLATGIFGRADSLGTDLGRLSQVMVQVVGVGAAALWGFGVCWILFRFIDSKSSLRVSLQHEDEGLNVAEHREPSALLDLVRGIEYQARTGAITEPIEAESFTEIGQIANQFNTLTTELRSMAEVAEQIADGRLDVEIMPRSDQDTFGLAFRRMVRDLRSTVSGISATATELTSSASALGGLANEVEAGVEVQTASISRSEVAFDQVSALIERLVDEVDILADRTGLALHGLALKMDTDQTQPEGIDSAGADQAAGVEDESDIKHAVQAIQRSANDINMVVDTVRSIAHTTNLLALNANIEAAKAGEHGKAFAIVANEVRDLATETVGSLKDIESIVGRLQSEAKGAVGIVDSVVGDVAELASSFGEITIGVNQAAGDLKLQAGEAKEAINSIEEISRHNATAASAFRTLSETVESEAKNVGDQVTRFSV